MAVAKLIFVFEDGKGLKSNTEFNLPPDLTTNSYQEIADELGGVLQALITGAITSVNLCIGLDVAAFTGTPSATSDVEEGARFIWNVAGGFTASNRIPTFNEALLVAGTSIVDETLPAVDAFDTLIDQGFTTTDDGLVEFVDSRGDDITGIRAAYEQFVKSRR